MNNNIEDLARLERLAYFKAWRAANREKTAKHRHRYWEKKALEKLNEGGVENEFTATDANAGTSV